MTDKVDQEKDEGRLSRWSRLKQAEREGHEAAPLAVTPETIDGAGQEAALASATAVEGDDEVEEIAAEDLPDIETMEKDSDYTPFMQKGVPEHLKKLALRKLWGSDPIFGFRDGLNDYDEDFSIIETINAALQSSYQVGKGMVSDDAKKEEERGGAEAAPEQGPEQDPEQGPEQDPDPVRAETAENHETSKDAADAGVTDQPVDKNPSDDREPTRTDAIEKI